MKRVFKTDKACLKKFDEYLEFCVKNSKFSNITGFCRFAGISRSTFYEQKNYYLDAIKKIEDILEDETLNNNNAHIAIRAFYLKNKCGYSDNPQSDNQQSVAIDKIANLLSTVKSEVLSEDEANK